jgi:hypothetical protein
MDSKAGLIPLKNAEVTTMGFDIGSIVEDVALVALTAYTGGATAELLGEQLAKQAIGEVFSDVIQQLPIDQTAKDALNFAVQSELGNSQQASASASQLLNDIGQQSGASPTQTGSLMNLITQFEQLLAQVLAQAQNGSTSSSGGSSNGSSGTSAADQSNQIDTSGLNNQVDDGSGDSSGPANGKTSKGGAAAGAGWLIAMAKALGQKIDQYAHQMEDAANKVDKNDPSTSTDFQVLSQEFSIVMNAATNAIKTAGEAMTTAARKN